MVLQKAMKQGRNVHGIPLLDACSDHNITSRMCAWTRWGACLLRFSLRSAQAAPPLFLIECAWSRLLAWAHQMNCTRKQKKWLWL